jgi:hypothetical protein
MQVNRMTRMKTDHAQDTLRLRWMCGDPVLAPCISCDHSRGGHRQ